MIRTIITLLLGAGLVGFVAFILYRFGWKKAKALCIDRRVMVSALVDSAMLMATAAVWTLIIRIILGINIFQGEIAQNAQAAQSIVSWLIITYLFFFVLMHTIAKWIIYRLYTKKWAGIKKVLMHLVMNLVFFSIILAIVWLFGIIGNTLVEAGKPGLGVSTLLIGFVLIGAVLLWSTITDIFHYTTDWKKAAKFWITKGFHYNYYLFTATLLIFVYIIALALLSILPWTLLQGVLFLLVMMYAVAWVRGYLMVNIHEHK